MSKSSCIVQARVGSTRLPNKVLETLGDAPVLEHVTPWIRRNRSYHRVNLSGPGGEVVAQRWTLDYPEDLAFLRAVYQRVPGGCAGRSWRAALAVVAREPQLALINETRRER